MQLTGDFFPQTSKILSVSELTRSIRAALETRFGAVWVEGEISNYRSHPNGNQYFTLKDSRAQIGCVIFRNAMPSLRTPLTDGAQVQMYGTVTVFEARGHCKSRLGDTTCKVVGARTTGSCRRPWKHHTYMKIQSINCRLHHLLRELCTCRCLGSRKRFHQLLFRR